MTHHLARYSVILTQLADIFIIFFSGVLCFLLYFQESIFKSGNDAWLVMTTAVASVIIFSFINVYDTWRGKVRVALVARLSRGYCYVALLLFSTLFLCKLGDHYARGWLILWLTFAFIGTVLLRIAVYRVLHHVRVRGWNKRSVALVGNADSCWSVLQSLQHAPHTGFHVTALRLDDHRIDAYPFPENTAFIADNLTFVCDEIWICLPLRESYRLEALLRQLSLLAVDIRYLPDMSDFRLMNYQLSSIANHYVFDLNCSPMRGLPRILKWLEDKIIAVLMMIVFLPVMLMVALMLFIFLGRPIFFRQERLSWNGKPFVMYKFRSMPVNQQHDAVWGQADQKTTSLFGKFLRRSNLDELPQLWNVLRGEMSLVGPRPEQTHYVEQFKYEIPNYMQKHMMKAGMTGWAQVHGFRGDTDLRKRIEYDLWYIENWSLWLDFKILYLTARQMILPKKS